MVLVLEAILPSLTSLFVHPAAHYISWCLVRDKVDLSMMARHENTKIGYSIVVARI